MDNFKTTAQRLLTQIIVWAHTQKKAEDILWDSLREAYEQGREVQRRKDIDILHNEGNEPEVAHWLAEQSKDVPEAPASEGKKP